MKSLGTELKLAREKRKVTLNDIALETKINIRYLRCLEEGRYSDLPGGIYNRAFLRSYCESIGADAKSFLLRYESETSPPIEKSVKAKTDSLNSRSIGFRVHPLFVWSFMLLLSLGGLYFNRKRMAAVFSPYFSSPALSSAQIPLSGEPASQQKAASEAAHSPSAPLSTEAVTEQPSSLALPVGGNPGAIDAPQLQTIHLEFEVLQNCWVSVRSDGTRVLVKELKPGDDQAVEASKAFYLILGNAGGVRLKINGKPLKLLGKPGQIVKILIDESNLPELLDKTAG
jgi:cytoskeleton protein RodZ